MHLCAICTTQYLLVAAGGTCLLLPATSDNSFSHTATSIYSCSLSFLSSCFDVSIHLLVLIRIVWVLELRVGLESHGVDAVTECYNFPS